MIQNAFSLGFRSYTANLDGTYCEEIVYQNSKGEFIWNRRLTSQELGRGEYGTNSWVDWAESYIAGRQQAERQFGHC